MTRWARHKKTEHDSSKWEDISENTGRAQRNKNSKPESSSKNESFNAHLEAVRKTVIKKNKRSENRRLKRQRRKQDNTLCFHCRMPGHGMADCPIMLRDNEQGTGICFKCGSTEHKSHTCTAKVEPGKEFMFAKCFICGEEGHLSKSCPDNPRGLYPNGGCCKLCGSVDHFQRDCPERRIKSEVTAYRMTDTKQGPFQSHISMDDEITLYQDEVVKQVQKPAQKKPKIVKF